MPREPHFGHVPGYPPGSLFEDRRALSASGVHRPPMAGICGRSAEGAESIVLNGGYVDDDDHGDTILYTGAGGNDPRTKRQVADQTLNRTNLALANNLRHGLPVRVIRGPRAGLHGPAAGCRYDGLWRVTDYWAEVGRDGYRIWRYRLEPAEVASGARGHTVGEQGELYVAPQRRVGEVSRIVRDTAVTRSVKRLHGHRCQVCGEAVETLAGPYAEAAHIRPLGAPHHGPDVLANVLCLCPNHHVAFDRWAFTLADDLSLIGLPGALRLHPKHVPDPEHVAYHREHALRARSEAA
ncbi:MAG: YDG/SRA domain-containing protein [Bacteroidota bacterium]